MDVLSGPFDVAFVAMLGLATGSFLNVVIHRLPLMLEQQWAQPSCDPAAPHPTTFNLLRPRSHCPACQHPIAWHENIPVLSFVWLRGRCSACHTRISLRYPLVELSTALLWVGVLMRYGPGPSSWAWMGFMATVLCLAWIDWQTTLLPDDLTLPLLWAGLIAATLGWSGTPLPDALWGAVAGYGALWAVYWIFKWITGKEGMGYGDFKLLAALGAWLGWAALIPMVLVASLLGIAAGLYLKWNSGLRAGGYLPFGPCLAAGAALVWYWGAEAFYLGLGL